MAKVTVLVAAYNATQYLDKCLQSLLDQTHTDWEAICVDDCSTDNMRHALLQWAARDGRIKVVSLDTNSGSAHARNVALGMASGEYVCMLDTDDWLSADALKLAVDTFEANGNTDAVLFDLHYEHDGQSTPYDMPQFSSLSGFDAFRMSLTWRIHGLYLVRTEIHKRYPYDETCRVYSDDNTTHLHYLVSREVRRCGGIYHYLQHETSVTHSVSVHRFDRLKAGESMRRQMLELKLPQPIIDEYETHRWLCLVDVCMFYHCHSRELSPAERRYGLSEIKRVRKGIDRKAIDRRIARKPGYWPMPAWWLFKIQEWVYFSLRSLLGRNN